MVCYINYPAHCGAGSRAARSSRPAYLLVPFCQRTKKGASLAVCQNGVANIRTISRLILLIQYCSMALWHLGGTSVRLHQKSLAKETRDVAGSSLLPCFHVCLPELENRNQCLEGGNRAGMCKFAIVGCSHRRIHGQTEHTAPKAAEFLLPLRILV